MTHHASSHETSEPTSVEARIDRLPRVVEALGGSDEHRRELLVERGEEEGLDRTAGEQAYDLAREERLDPAWGLALVLVGLSVQPLSSDQPDVETSESSEPEWVDSPPDPALAARERRLRQTFRRLRSCFEAQPTTDAAMEALAHEPDLETYDY